MLGLLLLVRRRNPQRNRNTPDRRGDPDARAVAAVVDAADRARTSTTPRWALLPKLVSVAYPLGDIILLAAAIRLVLDGGRRQPAFYLLGASIVSLLATDFVYGVMTLDNTFHHQLLLDLGWFSYQLLWGSAALHPSMAAMEEPARTRPGCEAKLTPLRLSLLTGASLIAPVCIFAEGAAPRRPRPDRDHLRSVVLFGLVVMRMVDLVRQQERSVARERLLGRCGAALVTLRHARGDAAGRAGCDRRRCSRAPGLGCCA